MTKTIGAYTIKRYPSLFEGIRDYTEYWKEDKLIATKWQDEGWQMHHISEEIYDTLTRAKGYRYWWKHFPDRYCWSLPQELQDALDMAPATRGYFVDRNGQLCGYEG